MNLFRTVLLLMVGLAGTGVALSREPVRQAMALAYLGLLLTVLFVVFQAPDVALSQVVVGGVAFPLMVVLTVAKIRRSRE
ncbi:Na(+)/H(+) antiporter subunit B [Archangium sp.]|uniref:Na(+)/H(+) antiporter subunit B n=1 Tax=Archangium sp. TaxID=1872627 RepID=UPI003899FFA8